MICVCVGGGGGPHHLADVVAPGQKQDARVVFLPVGQDEGEKHHPQDVVERDHAHAALPAPEYGVHGGHEEDARPAVQAVVEQLPQRRRGVGAAGLFPVDAVWWKKTTTKKRYAFTDERCKQRDADVWHLHPDKTAAHSREIP